MNNVQVHSLEMMKIQENHNKISEIVNGNDVVYLDIPVHDNFGDLLIMMGTLKFFKKKKIIPKFIFSAHNFMPRALCNNDILVFHGGGNLGDLYSFHQNHREEVIGEFLDNRIVILPQTIHYKSDVEYQKTCKIFKKHNDLHVCVRDKKSYDLALGMTDKVYLMPDMAHHLYPVLPSADPVKSTLLLNRMDIEAIDFKFDEGFDDETDWSILLKNKKWKINGYIRLQKIIKLFGFNKYLSQWINKKWIEFSKVLLVEVTSYYSKYDSIITTRLHGHIFSCLMNKKSVVFDNSYGKNSAYYDLWTKKSPITEIKGRAR